MLSMQSDWAWTWAEDELAEIAISCVHTGGDIVQHNCSEKWHSVPNSWIQMHTKHFKDISTKFPK